MLPCACSHVTVWAVTQHRQDQAAFDRSVEISGHDVVTAVCALLQSALRLKPSFTDAYNNMASALVQKGLIPQAVECYNAALQINPNLVCHGPFDTYDAFTINAFARHLYWYQCVVHTRTAPMAYTVTLEVHAMSFCSMLS